MQPRRRLPGLLSFVSYMVVNMAPIGSDVGVHDHAVFAVGGSGLRPTKLTCDIEWSSDRGMWRAWGSGLQTFANDREHAALKLFAAQREVTSAPSPSQPVRLHLAVVPALLLFAVAIMVFAVLGALDVAGVV